jgi:hypothetical protein
MALGIAGTRRAAFDRKDTKAVWHGDPKIGRGPPPWGMYSVGSMLRVLLLLLLLLLSAPQLLSHVSSRTALVNVQVYVE